MRAISDRERTELPDGETCERIVHAALAAGDMQGVEAALQVMAVTDPVRAEGLVEVMRVGLDLADRIEHHGEVD